MGLIGMQQGAMPQGGMAQSPAAQPGQSQPVPGGTQEDYDKLVSAGTSAIYTPAIMQKILAMIKASPSPAQGLLRATAIVMRQLNEMSKQTIPDAIKIPASKEIMGLIAELAEKAGVIQDAGQALQEASQIIDQKSGGAPGGEFQPLVDKGAAQPPVQSMPAGGMPSAGV